MRCLITFIVTLAAIAQMASPARAETLSRADGSATPIKLYGPSGGCGPALIISHGFGGDENGNAGLAAAMGGAGWRVLVMGHRESGRSQLRSALMNGSPRASIIEATTTPPPHKARLLDLDAAIAAMTRLCRPSTFVLAGHSMGAMTTMLEAGAVARFGRFGSDRFDAYVAVSPQGVGHAYAEGAWRNVKKPVLMITGSRDRGSDGEFTTRLSAFDGLPPGRKRLAIIPEAGHLALAANRRDAVGAAVASLTLEFADSVARRAALTPSSVPDVDTRDK